MFLYGYLFKLVADLVLLPLVDHRHQLDALLFVDFVVLSDCLVPLDERGDLLRIADALKVAILEAEHLLKLFKFGVVLVL